MVVKWQAYHSNRELGQDFDAHSRKVDHFVFEVQKKRVMRFNGR